jgi:hypothetical protein
VSLTTRDLRIRVVCKPLVLLRRKTLARALECEEDKGAVRGEDDCRMNLGERVKRVSTLPPNLRAVLACIAEGMSNEQIASRLFYKNSGTVATLIHELYSELGLRYVVSVTEKRALAAQAFQKATEREFKISMTGEGLDFLALNDADGKRLKSALRNGYEIHSISIVLRRR